MAETSDTKQTSTNPLKIPKRKVTSKNHYELVFIGGKKVKIRKKKKLRN